MRDVIVVGGGCYGTFYVAQLAKAKQRDKARFRRGVGGDRDSACRARVELGDAPDRAYVGRDWTTYFGEVLGAPPPPPAGEPQDYILPAPLVPPLLVEW